jgi:hypothetical protein
VTGLHVEVDEIIGGPDFMMIFSRLCPLHTGSRGTLGTQYAHTMWIERDKVVRSQQAVNTRAGAEALV